MRLLMYLFLRSNNFRRPEGKRAVGTDLKRPGGGQWQAGWNDWSTARAIARDRVAYKQNVVALFAYWGEEQEMMMTTMMMKYSILLALPCSQIIDETFIHHHH